MRSRSSPIGSRLAVAVISRAPSWSVLAATRAMGRAARLPLPSPVARAAVGTYARMFDVDLDEVDPDIAAGRVRTFDEFFTRPLRTGARQWPGAGAAGLVSPCDGKLRDVGPVLRNRNGEGGTHVEAKGFRYSVGTLLADAAVAKRFEGGAHATIYLHPRDYHRVHAPAAGQVESVTVVPGRLLPVNDASLAAAPRLFTHNERMVHLLRVGDDWLAVVMVAAFGVGHMTCSYASVDVHARRVAQRRFGDDGPTVAAGDELGVFHLGSTVVVLASPGLAGALVSKRGRDKIGKIRVGEMLSPHITTEASV